MYKEIENMTHMQEEGKNNQRKPNLRWSLVDRNFKAAIIDTLKDL